MWPLLVFIAWPLIEIGLFVVIGGEIGLWATLAVILGTGVLGVVLLRLEAARGAMMLRGGVAMREGAPIGGLFRGLAAMFLILPGFLTDGIGLLLLLPPIQALLAGVVLSRVKMMGAGAFPGFGAQGFGQGAGAGFGTDSPGWDDAGTQDRSKNARPSHTDDGIIDGEWEDVSPADHSRPRIEGQRPSGWTRDQ